MCFVLSANTGFDKLALNLLSVSPPSFCSWAADGRSQTIYKPTPWTLTDSRYRRLFWWEWAWWTAGGERRIGPGSLPLFFIYFFIIFCLWIPEFVWQLDDNYTSFSLIAQHLAGILLGYFPVVLMWTCLKISDAAQDKTQVGQW